MQCLGVRRLEQMLGVKTRPKLSFPSTLQHLTSFLVPCFLTLKLSFHFFSLSLSLPDKIHLVNARNMQPCPRWGEEEVSAFFVALVGAAGGRHVNQGCVRGSCHTWQPVNERYHDPLSSPFISPTLMERRGTTSFHGMIRSSTTIYTTARWIVCPTALWRWARPCSRSRTSQKISSLHDYTNWREETHLTTIHWSELWKIITLA